MNCALLYAVMHMHESLIYTVIHKKRGSTFVIITLENLDGF